MREMKVNDMPKPRMLRLAVASRSLSRTTILQLGMLLKRVISTCHAALRRIYEMGSAQKTLPVDLYGAVLPTLQLLYHLFRRLFGLV